MAFLKLKNPNQLYGQLHGKVDGNHRLELVEDINGDYFIHQEIKDHHIWEKFNNLFDKLDVVDNVIPKIHNI